MLVLGRSLQNITKQQSLYCIILSEKKRHDEERERERGRDEEGSEVTTED